MKPLLLILVFLCSNAMALDLRVGQAGHKSLHGVTVVIEQEINGKYLSYAHLIHPYPDPDKKSHQWLDADGNCPYCYKDGRKKVRRQGILFYQWQFGKKYYWRVGPGIGNSTPRNAWLNLCQSFGVDWGMIDISWTHCSNAGLIRPNSGVDFLTGNISKVF